MMLERTATPLEPAELASTFLEAARREGLLNLGAKAFAILLGIIALENADGRAIVQHNWGNLSAGAAWRAEHDWWPPATLQPGQPQAFKAFPDHLSGAQAWWRQMRQSYRPVLAAAVAGAPYRTVAELYARHYVVGGDARGYASKVEQTGRRWTHFFPRPLGVPGVLALSAGVAGVVAAIALTWR